MGLSRKGSFEERDTDGHQGEREACAHTHTSTPTHTHTKKACTGDWLITWVHTICRDMADNLLSRPLLRNAHKHICSCMHTNHFLFLSPFFFSFNCSTSPPQTHSLAYWYAILFMFMCAAKIKNLPADRNAWRSVFPYQKSNTEDTSEDATGNLNCKLSVNPSLCEMTRCNDRILSFCHFTSD